MKKNIKPPAKAKDTRKPGNKNTGSGPVAAILKKENFSWAKNWREDDKRRKSK